VICDFGLNFFKKYTAISTADSMDKYINKSQYTAPEILEEKGTAADKISEEADVYSFGMIMW